MILIPPDAQSDLENLTQFLAPDNSIRIYKDNQLMYGFRDGQVFNQFTQKDFFDLLEAFESPIIKKWEITGQGTKLLDPFASQTNYTIAASPFRLGLAVKKGELSLSQALCGYWHQLGVLDDLVPPITTAIVEEVTQYQKLTPSIFNSQDRSLKTSLNSSSNVTLKPLPESERLETDLNLKTARQQLQFDFNLSTPVVLGLQSIPSDKDKAKAPNFNEIWHSTEWINALIREQSLQRFLQRKDKKLVFTLGDDEIEFIFNNESQQWEYNAGELTPESLQSISQLVQKPSPSKKSGLELS